MADSEARPTSRWPIGAYSQANPIKNCHPERSEGSAVRGKMQILASLGMTKI
jgi:hypothetical protein